MKKYELTTEFKINFFGRKLFRIRALISFGNVNEGDLGGYIEDEKNLSHDGNAWVYGDAKVYGDAEVCGDAKVYGNAWVCGNAKVCGDAKVYGDAWVCGDAKVYGDAEVCGDAKVYGNAWVCGNAKVCGDADYTTIKGFGRCFRTTTFFKCKDGLVRVTCGCFYGTIAEFKAKVEQTHGKSKLAIEYLKISELMEYHFSAEVENEKD